MGKKRIYFCQGCSAVFDHRVKFCPHCGTKQYYEDECKYCGAEISEFDEKCPKCYEKIKFDEDKTRYCPECGNNLDIDDRDLERKYCNGSDCGKEIGGLIRYSQETGEPLTVGEIMIKNDYNKEIKDWLTNLHNNVFGTYSNCFNRMLYIYDKTDVYSSNNFQNDYVKIFDDIFIHNLSDFIHLHDEENINILLDKGKHPKKYNQHCICVINIAAYDDYIKSGAYDEYIEAHHFLEYYKDIYYNGGEYDYSDTVRNIVVTFVFTSYALPEESKIGSMYDKHFLIITPEILEELDIEKIWKEIKEKHNET